MAKLEVANIHWGDVYKDLARVPEPFRVDGRGRVIPEGTICRVSTPSGRSLLLALRGQRVHVRPAIHLDERSRNRLGVGLGQEVDFGLRPLGRWGQFRWALGASDPAYRVASQLAVLSAVLGFLGLVLGIAGVWIAVK